MYVVHDESEFSEKTLDDENPPMATGPIYVYQLLE